MQYLGYTYAKILFTVYLKPEFKGAFCILSSNLITFRVCLWRRHDASSIRRVRIPSTDPFLCTYYVLGPDLGIQP